MILEYIQLVGSASAKDIFNQSMGAYMKEIEVKSPAFMNNNPTELRRQITMNIQNTLNGLVADGQVQKLTHSTGQIFYHV